MNKKLLIVVNTVEFFISHRLPIALAMKESGWNVVVATGSKDGADMLRGYGINHKYLSLSRSGKSLIKEFMTCLKLRSILVSERPSVVHFVTIKPVLYGGLVLYSAAPIPAVFAISGLGSVFSNREGKGFIRGVVKFLYKLALAHNEKIVIFQNTTDKKVLMELCGLDESQTVLVNGSGVDLNQYNINRLRRQPEGGRVRFVIACRLLREKGVYECLVAAKSLAEEGLDFQLVVAGDVDQGNPQSLTLEDCDKFRDCAHIKFIGFCDDVASLYRDSDVALMPSYYGEGVPKSLIEAAASGLPIITTDMPGCRDTVIPNKSGILVRPRNYEDVCNAMRMFIKQPELLTRYSEVSRSVAESKFSIEEVVGAHKYVYENLVRPNT